MDGIVAMPADSAYILLALTEDGHANSLAAPPQFWVNRVPALGSSPVPA